MIKDDGDIIRACGFLAIYSGNLEGELDELYEIAQSFCPELANYAHLRFTDKARHLRKTLARRFKTTPDYFRKEDDERRVGSVLAHCKKVADARNEILHSSIYSDKSGRTVMQNRRKGIRTVRSAGVYRLANEIFRMNGSVYGLQFAVGRLQGAVAKSSGT